MGEEGKQSAYLPYPLGRVSPCARSLTCETRGQRGMALLLALFVMISLSGLALSLVLLTDSQIRLGKTVEAQTQVYYAALAGLEEARGRLNATAPDSIVPSLPTNVTEVLYLVNSSSQDPVDPTNASSPYYDDEYAQEFSGGFTAATVLPSVASDQPGAGTASAIPYKWVRITLKTEYSSHQDVDQNGVLDSSTSISSDGWHQDLSTHMTNGVPVYKLTALAVGPSHIRKLVQAEVAAPGRLNASASLATAASAHLHGLGGAAGYNLSVDGSDACGVQTTPLPGIIAGGTVTLDRATVTPNFLQNVSPFPQSASSLISALRASATPILNADPTHVTLASGGTAYVGTNAVLGTQPSGTTPAQPAVVYSDKPLMFTSGTTTGDGILLVDGDLFVSDGFNYRGMIVVDGTVTLVSHTTYGISISGTLVSSGDLSAHSTDSASTPLTIKYDSCAATDGAQVLPKTILAYKELSY